MRSIYDFEIEKKSSSTFASSCRAPPLFESFRLQFCFHFHSKLVVKHIFNFIFFHASFTKNTGVNKVARGDLLDFRKKNQVGKKGIGKGKVREKGEDQR